MHLPFENIFSLVKKKGLTFWRWLSIPHLLNLAHSYSTLLLEQDQLIKDPCAYSIVDLIS